MVASPNKKDEAEKYQNMTLEELKNECKNRKLDIEDNDTKEKLIELLIEDDKKPTDWGKVYSIILYHTSMHYEEISRRTIPQLQAILDNANENISIKKGMPNIFGGSPSESEQPPNDGKPPKVSQFAALANMFSVLK